MRRPLHCLLVGFLIFSLSVDTARACWRLRHAHRGHAAPACPVEPGCGGWSAVVVADVAVGCGWAAYPAETAVVVPAGCFVEEIGCGQPLDCCGGDVDGLTLEPHGIALRQLRRTSDGPSHQDCRQGEAQGASLPAMRRQTGSA